MKNNVYNRDGVRTFNAAQSLAEYNANTLGGSWVIWVCPSSGLFRVTCPELVEGYIRATTNFENGVAGLSFAQVANHEYV